MKKIVIFILALIVALPLYAADTAMDSFTDDSASPVTTDYLVGYSGTAGYRWTIASIIGLAPAVTLAASAASILGLSTQEISFDTQTANYVLAGPTSGVAAAPAFRALVSADIPNNAANTSGNAGTATALAANGSNCSAGSYPLGVSETGAAESCTAAPTAASLHLDDVLTALGIASEAVNFGSFTGSTFLDNQTAKALFQATENALEGKADAASTADYTEPGTNLPLCRTGSGTIGGCTNVTDVAFSSYAPLANPQFTGVVDIPVGATTDAEGEITIDTTTNQLRYYGGAQRVLSPIQHASFVITAPADTDDINIMKAPYGMTITGINCIVQGTTSATGQLQECSATGTDCADLDSDITCDADGAADDGTLTDSAIAANAWLRWKTTSLSGTPTFLTVTFKYLVVAD